MPRRVLGIFLAPPTSTSYVISPSSNHASWLGFIRTDFSRSTLNYAVPLSLGATFLINVQTFSFPLTFPSILESSGISGVYSTPSFHTIPDWNYRKPSPFHNFPPFSPPPPPVGRFAFHGTQTPLPPDAVCLPFPCFISRPRLGRYPIFFFCFGLVDSCSVLVFFFFFLTKPILRSFQRHVPFLSPVGPPAPPLPHVVLQSAGACP